MPSVLSAGLCSPHHPSSHCSKITNQAERRSQGDGKQLRRPGNPCSGQGGGAQPSSRCSPGRYTPTAVLYRVCRGGRPRRRHAHRRASGPLHARGRRSACSGARSGAADGVQLHHGRRRSGVRAGCRCACSRARRHHRGGAGLCRRRRGRRANGRRRADGPCRRARFREAAGRALPGAQLRQRPRWPVR